MLDKFQKCIICNSQEDLTYEHIIPESLGNYTLGEKFVCKNCNSKMGSKIDSVLCNNPIIQLFRSKYDIKGKKGNTVKMQGEFAGKKASFKNGKIKISNSFEKTGENTYTASADTFEELEKIIVSGLKRRKISDEEVQKQIEKIPVDSQVKRYENVSFKANFTYDRNEYIMPIIKIAYEYACHALGPKYLEDVVGNNLKSYIYEFLHNEKHLVAVDDFVIDIYKFLEIQRQKYDKDGTIDKFRTVNYFNKCSQEDPLPIHLLGFSQMESILFVTINLFAHPLLLFYIPVSICPFFDLYEIPIKAEGVVCSDDIEFIQSMESILEKYLEDKSLFSFYPI